MEKYIVLLRGVMPSGKNSIKMATLKEIIENEGFHSVKTYIQSGNIILKSDLDKEKIAFKIHCAIKNKTEATFSIIVKTPNELKMVLEQNPFDENYLIERVFFTLTNQNYDKNTAKELSEQDFKEEKLIIGENAFYMYLPKDASRSKLNNNYLEKKLKIVATTRNFNTLSTLVRMAEEIKQNQ